MREIPLTKGMVALVSDEDFERVSKFKWMASPSNQYRGYRHNPKWYACRWEELPRVNGKRRKRKVYLHRWLADAPAGMVVDHINGNSLDNRRENLAMATYQENAQNRTVEWN